MDPWASEALAALDGALRGETPPLEFLPAGEDGIPRWTERPDLTQMCWNVGKDHSEDVRAHVPAHLLDGPAEQPAVVVRTSGSTGTPKQTLLTSENLRTSAEATAAALGGHGQWLLTLQPSYVAGLAVLSRSLFGGTTPVTLVERTTDPARFIRAAEELTGERRYVSLVPTQLERLLDSYEQSDALVSVGKDHTTAAERQERGHQTQSPAQQRLLQALRRFDAILLGGGPSSPELVTRAEELGLTVIRTYGMSETAGGCIYDGRPLPGVRIGILPEGGPPAQEEPDQEDAPCAAAGHSPMAQTGRVVLSGPMVAAGYLDPELSASRFDVDPVTGQRRFLTDDLGRLTPASHLMITGRADDVIITGGVKVSAEEIRQVLEADPEVQEAFVAGVPDPEWGEQVAAAVVLTGMFEGEFAPLPPSAEAEELPSCSPREWLRTLNITLRERLGVAAVPKQIRFLRSLPRLPNGKPDRQRLSRMLST